MIVTYRVASDAKSIEQRATGIAIEQSVECPLEAIADPRIVDEIVGKVEGIAEWRLAATTCGSGSRPRPRRRSPAS